ncbi:MAG TPA: YidB family protein [Methylobacterium sp.]|nr:YidB family protein [Methylobacterium sp.]
MSRGYPSMTALLGLLAVAGYQNRDKIAELLGGLGKEPARPPGQGSPSASQTPGPSGLGGLLGGAGAGGVGGLIASGLSELVDHFTQNGHGEAAKSWVNQGPNHDLPSSDLEKAIGPDLLATLAQQTGLSRDELLSRLSRDLPTAIDRYSPDGRVPA